MLEFTMVDATQRDIIDGVISHFPTRRREIERLAQDCGAFLELCEELAAAEQTLANIDKVDIPCGAERRLEWLSFIRRTLMDIEGHLKHHNVLILDLSRKRQP